MESSQFCELPIAEIEEAAHNPRTVFDPMALNGRLLTPSDPHWRPNSWSRSRPQKPTTLFDLVAAATDWHGEYTKAATKALPAAKTSDDVVRRAAFVAALRELRAWNAVTTFPKWAKKALGLDVARLLKDQQNDGAAARAKAAPPTKGKKR